MEITNTILKIVPFVSILLIFIVWLQNRRKKKSGIEKEEKPSKLKQWFKTTEIYKIFVERASLRPVSSAFFYAIFVVPASLIFIIGIAFLNMKPPVQLKDINPIEGYITKVVWIERGKGSDYINLKISDGTETTYLIHMNQHLFDKLNSLKNKQDIVTVYPYQRYYINIMGTKHIADVKYKNEFLKGYFVDKSIEKFTDKKKFNIKNIYNFFYNTWFGLKIALIGFFFIFLLNYEEKPIHRLNRMKKYLKNKDDE